MQTWYYESRGAQRGPVSEEELHSLHARGEVTDETLVWKDGMQDWQPMRLALTSQPGSLPARPAFAGDPTPPYTREVENHLVKAILVTIFCCLPLGVVSIVFAAQVKGKADAGQYGEAERLSGQANTWANWGIGVGIAWMVISFAFMAMSGFSGAFDF